MRILVPLAAAAALLLPAAEVIPMKGKLLFEDEFTGTALKPTWKTPNGKWTVADGKLKGVELAADKHAAVARHPVKYHNAMIELKFRMDGAKMTAMSINREGGHACRIVLRPEGLTVQKDKFARKPDDKPAVLAKLDKPIAAGWHTLLVEVRGKRMAARLDDGQWIAGEHDDIDVGKTDVGLPVAGDSTTFESIRVWALP